MLIVELQGLFAYYSYKPLECFLLLCCSFLISLIEFLSYPFRMILSPDVRHRPGCRISGIFLCGKHCSLVKFYYLACCFYKDFFLILDLDSMLNIKTYLASNFLNIMYRFRHVLILSFKSIHKYLDHVI